VVEDSSVSRSDEGRGDTSDEKVGARVMFNTYDDVRGAWRESSSSIPTRFEKKVVSSKRRVIGVYEFEGSEVPGQLLYKNSSLRFDIDHG
jgi:hypothetical protein